MISQNSIKEKFPIFKNIPNLVYLDNAATTQKPKEVLDAEFDFYTTYNSNIHRGLYPIAVRASNEYEFARKKIAKFINAGEDEIIFTSGTTDSINILADSLLISNLMPSNPKILVSKFDHHSNILPWQKITQNLCYASKLNFTQETEDYDLVSLFLANNVTGEVLDVKKLRNKFRESILVLDASQAAAHVEIDVKEIDVDFLVLSAHKMYGPTGIGVLYAKKHFLEKLQPTKRGGGMIREVLKNTASWTEGPAKFEAGTPNIAGAIGMGAASEFLLNIGFDFIKKHESTLKNYLIEKLNSISDIKIFHSENNNTIGVVSIFIENTHPHDIAEFLGNFAICVRAGHHCTQILHREILEVPATLRISLGVYNSKEDIDLLIQKLIEAISLYKKTKTSNKRE